MTTCIDALQNGYDEDTIAYGEEADELRDEAIDYVYVDPTWDGHWSDSVPLELLYDSADELRYADKTRFRLYRFAKPESVRDFVTVR